MSAAALRAELAVELAAFKLQVSLVVEPGTLALAGPSGSGKSSLLKLLLGALRPSRWRIELGGRVLFDQGLGIDIAPEARRFRPHVTVGRLRTGARPARRIAAAPEPVTFAGGPVVLYRSILGHGPANYEPLWSSG